MVETALRPRRPTYLDDPVAQSSEEITGRIFFPITNNFLEHRKSYIKPPFKPENKQHKPEVKTRKYIIGELKGQIFKSGIQSIGIVQFVPPGTSSKLASPWKPYYTIVQQLSPVRFEQQGTNKSVMVHVQNLRTAHPQDAWDKLYNNKQRESSLQGTWIQPACKAKFVDAEALIDPDRGHAWSSEDHLLLAYFAIRCEMMKMTEILLDYSTRNRYRFPIQYRNTRNPNLFTVSQSSLTLPGRNFWITCRCPQHLHQMRKLSNVKKRKSLDNDSHHEHGKIMSAPKRECDIRTALFYVQWQSCKRQRHSWADSQSKEEELVTVSPHKLLIRNQSSSPEVRDVVLLLAYSHHTTFRDALRNKAPTTTS